MLCEKRLKCAVKFSSIVSLQPSWRQDDNGNHFAVQSGLTYQAAKASMQELEGRGHKQFY